MKICENLGTPQHLEEGGEEPVHRGHGMEEERRRRRRGGGEEGGGKEEEEKKEGEKRRLT